MGRFLVWLRLLGLFVNLKQYFRALYPKPTIGLHCAQADQKQPIQWICNAVDITVTPWFICVILRSIGAKPVTSKYGETWWSPNFYSTFKASVEVLRTLISSILLNSFKAGLEDIKVLKTQLFQVYYRWGEAFLFLHAGAWYKLATQRWAEWRNQWNVRES